MRRILLLGLCVVLVAVLVLPATMASGSGGVVWAEVLVPGLSSDIKAVEFHADGEIGTMLAGKYVWQTFNGGATWSKNEINDETPIALGDSYAFNDIAVSATGQYMWAVGHFSDRQGTIPPYTYEISPTIFYSSDFGETWTNQTANISEDLTGYGDLNAAGWDNSLGPYACGDNGLVLCATNGFGIGADAWHVVSYEQVFDYNDISRGLNPVGSTDPRLVAVGSNGWIGTYDYSLNTTVWYGANTQQYSTGYTFNGVEVVNALYQLVLAVGENGQIAWSNDAGGTWAHISTGASHSYNAVDTVDGTGGGPYVAWTAGDSGLTNGLFYNDDTDTWYTAQGGYAGTEDLLDISCAHNIDELWAVGVNGTVQRRATSSTDRTAGTDRYYTAIEMSSDWPDDSCDTVVMATGLDFPDALSAAGLAGAYECPLILTGSTLRQSVKDEITRLGADTVVIIGGESAVPSVVSDALTGAGFTVDRDLAGSNRYDTARLVAERIEDLEGVQFSEYVFIARGDGFADALALSPLAYSQKIPILLTKPTSLPGDTATALDTLDFQTPIIAGGEAAVSATVETAIETITLGNGGTDNAERWQGSNRYATAASIAENGLGAGWATPAFVGLAVGTNFPDALGGGPVCGSSGGVMLLTKSLSLSFETGDFLTDNSGDVIRIQVFGGTSAVSDAVKDAADALIQ